MGSAGFGRSPSTMGRSPGSPMSKTTKPGLWIATSSSVISATAETLVSGRPSRYAQMVNSSTGSGSPSARISAKRTTTPGRPAGTTARPE